MQFSTTIVLSNIEEIKLRRIIKFYKEFLKKKEEENIDFNPILNRLELETIKSIEKKMTKGSTESSAKLEKLKPKRKVNKLKFEWLHFKLNILNIRNKYFKVKDYEDKVLLIHQEFVNLRRNKK